MPLGVIIAQTIHAAGESSLGPCLPKDTHAIALAVSNEFELLKLEHILIQQNIPYTSIREPDERYLGQLMAIGIVPSNDSNLRKLLRKLPLIKGEVIWKK